MDIGYSIKYIGNIGNSINNLGYTHYMHWCVSSHWHLCLFIQEEWVVSNYWHLYLFTENELWAVVNIFVHPGRMSWAVTDINCSSRKNELWAVADISVHPERTSCEQSLTSLFIQEERVVSSCWHLCSSRKNELWAVTEISVHPGGIV